MKCGANPAQMIRSVRRAILAEAQFRRVTPEMMARVEGIMKKIRLNVVDGPRTVGTATPYPDPDPKKLFAFFADTKSKPGAYFFTRRLDESDEIRLTPREAKSFIRNGDLPRRKQFMKAYSIAKNIPQGEGEEMALMEAAENGFGVFIRGGCS